MSQPLACYDPVLCSVLQMRGWGRVVVVGGGEAVMQAYMEFLDKYFLGY